MLSKTGLNLLSNRIERLVGYFGRDFHPCMKTFGPCRRSYHVGVVFNCADSYCKEVVGGEDRYSHRLNGRTSRSNVETLV